MPEPPKTVEAETRPSNNLLGPRLTFGTDSDSIHFIPAELIDKIGLEAAWVCHPACDDFLPYGFRECNNASGNVITRVFQVSEEDGLVGASLQARFRAQILG